MEDQGNGLGRVMMISFVFLVIFVGGLVWNSMEKNGGKLKDSKFSVVKKTTKAKSKRKVQITYDDAFDKVLGIKK